ncbi:hypothetical protein, partial [Paracoccus halophilus]
MLDVGILDTLTTHGFVIQRVLGIDVGIEHFGIHCAVNPPSLHSPSGVSFEVKIACIRALDKDFLPQAAPAV